MDIDERLSAWGEQARSTDVDTPEVPVRRFGARHTRALVAAPVVVAVGVTAAIVGSQLLGGPAHHGTGAPARKTGPNVQSGTSGKAYTFHGLTLTVPASWPIDALHCATPKKDTVLLPSGTLDCLDPRTPHVTVVAFGADAARLVTVAHPATTTITIDSHTAIKTIGTSAGSETYTIAKGDHVILLSVPSLGVSVAIQSPNETLATKIADTARIVDTDANGCVANRHDLVTLPAGQPPVRPRADTKLIPGMPIHLAVCRYENGGLEQGATVTGGAKLKFIGTLNGLPTGLSVGNDYAPSECPDERTHPHGFTVIATYDHGPAVTVWVRLGTCKLLGASNGTHTGQRTRRLINTVENLVGGSAEGWPMQVSPAPRRYR